MKVEAIKTRNMEPPVDDLRVVFKAAVQAIEENTVIVLASKVVSIDEGRCAPIEGTDKLELVKKEADRYLPIEHTPGRKHPITMVHNVIVGSAGIDESNANGFYILLPENPMQYAKEFREWVVDEYGVEHVGVIIADSYSTILRRGAQSVGIGFAGIKPLYEYKGRKDIFDREFKFSSSNVLDTLSSGAGIVMGEGSSPTPIALITEPPESVVFETGREAEFAKDFFVYGERDRLRMLYDGLPWKDNE